MNFWFFFWNFLNLVFYNLLNSGGDTEEKKVKNDKNTNEKKDTNEKKVTSEKNFFRRAIDSLQKAV